jgi:hypothetical protein
MRNRLGIDQAKARFMGQRSRLERLARLFLCQSLRRQLALLAVHQRQEPFGRAISSLEFVNVVENARRDANGQDRQLADRFVFRTSRYIDHEASMQLDRLVVEDKCTLAVEDVIKLVRPLVIVELGAIDLDMMDLGGSVIFCLDQRSDLPTGLSPRFYLR